MKKSGGGFAVIVSLAMVLFFVFFTACAPNGLVMPAASPTLTAVPTAAIAPTPTPTMNAQDIEEAKFNQDIQDFINETGEYTEDAISNRLISYHNEILDLGWIRGNGNVISLQGWFINYVSVGDYLVLAVGFDGKDGKNHVKPVAIPIKYFEAGNQSVNFSFEEMGDWNMITSHHKAWESNPDNIINRLNTVKDNPVILTFYNNMTDGTTGDAVKMFGEGCEPYFNELNDTDNLTNNLVSEVSVLNNEKILSRKADYNSNADDSIPDIQSVDDLKNIDISMVPRVFGMGSNLW